jgi:hypothetical protein
MQWCRPYPWSTVEVFIPQESTKATATVVKTLEVCVHPETSEEIQFHSSAFRELLVCLRPWGFWHYSWAKVSSQGHSLPDMITEIWEGPGVSFIHLSKIHALNICHMLGTRPSESWSQPQTSWVCLIDRNLAAVWKAWLLAQRTQNCPVGLLPAWLGPTPGGSDSGGAGNAPFY